MELAAWTFIYFVIWDAFFFFVYILGNFIQDLVSKSHVAENMKPILIFLTE